MKLFLLSITILISTSVFAKTQIRWTSYGVPHILAQNWLEAGKASGYAFSSQNACTLIDQVLRIRGERSKYFGVGPKNVHRKMDIAYKVINFTQRAKKKYPFMSKRGQDLLKGYVLGFNRYIDEVGKYELSGSCRGKNWAQKITLYDLLGVHLSVAMLAGTDMLWEFIYSATRPFKGEHKVRPFELPKMKDFSKLGLGSNGWAFGSDYTKNGKGMLLANPHMPYYGSLKFYEMHINIPGEYNVSGATLFGVPIPLIGFNEKVAWTHTFAYTTRTMNFYSLNLKFGDRYSYRYGDEYRKFKEKIVSIEVLGEDGKLKVYKRRAYFSHYGPLIETFGLWWGLTRAYTFRDANEENFNFVDQWIEMGKAQSMDAFIDAHRTMSSPWAFTLGTSSKGEAMFINSLPVQKVSDEAWDYFFKRIKWNPILSYLWKDFHLATFDGSNPDHEWLGRETFESAPKLFVNSYTSNHNETHWLTNVHEPLTGFSKFYGKEEYPQDLRTRVAHSLIAQGSGEDKKFTIEELKETFFNGKNILRDLVKDDLKELCENENLSSYTSYYVRKSDLELGCRLILSWDGKMLFGKSGAILFREWASYFTKDNKLYGEKFDKNRPVQTPAGIKNDRIGRDRKHKAIVYLAKAIKSLKKNGFSIDVLMEDIQYLEKGSQRVPIPGGFGQFGNLNLIQTNMPAMGFRTIDAPKDPKAYNKNTLLTKDGYKTVFGTSFIFFLEYDKNDRPLAKGLTIYSQTNDENDPHFNDQIHLWNKDELRPILYYEQDIANDKNLKVKNLEF